MQISGRPVIINDTHEYEGWIPAPASEWIRSTLGVPIKIKDEIIGFLSLARSQANSFTRQDIEHLQAFVNYAGIAIENARLRRRAERTAVAAERNRIARDLHDETGQSLTAIGMGLRGLANETDSKKRLVTLTQLQSLTSDSIRELQRIISDLRPAHLDDLGLSATLRWYASRVHELTSLHVRVDIEGDEPALDDAVKITIFRIMQEALNNVIKHAQATTVNVKIHYLQKEVRIHVFDNGVGFEMKAVQNRIGRVSLGLAGMEERAALLGGGVTVSSRPGYGTEVEAVVPLHLIDQEEK